MEYNTALFGEKRTIFQYVNGTYTRLYEIGSQNISVEQGFNSEAFEKQAQLPTDLALWEIGDESVLTRLTWRKKVNNQRVVHHSNDDKDRVKMMLATNGARINTTTFDIADTGSTQTYMRSAQCNYRNLTTQNNFNPIQQYPLWNPVAGVISSAPHFGVTPFIMDFDYSGLLLCVYVATGSTTMTLKQFLDNNNTGTRITALYVEPTFGNATKHLRPLNTRFENGNSSLNLYGVHLVNSKTYDLPLDVRADLGVFVPSFIMASRIQTQFNISDNIMVIVDTPASASSYRVSYYQDEERIDDLGIIPHGENNTYNQDDIDWMLKQVALLGFWFTTDDSNVQDRVTGTGCTDVNTYLPEIKDGITTGRYWSGTAAAEQDAASWGDDWREKVNYQPGGGSKEEKDFGNLNTVLHRGSIAAGCKWYGLTETQLNGLVTWMNSGYQPTSNDQFVNDFKGVNPAEYITSITYLPFYPIPSGTDELINIGPLSTAVSGRKIAYEYGVTVDLGYYTLDRYFDDFRDFKPYTAISLYIPFCGTVELDAANYYNRTINVKLMIDMSTGSCTGLVLANDLLIDTISGQCGVKIPLAAFNMGDYQDAIINAQYQLKQAERQRDNAMIGAGIAIVGGAITAGTGIGAVAGAAAAIYAVNKMYDARDRIENIEYNIEHMQPKQTNISTGSPTNSLGMEYDARLIITRPSTLDTDINIYGHTVGYMTNKQGVLSDFSGFTQCSNADLSGIPMTSSELASIHEALKSGVYLP